MTEVPLPSTPRAPDWVPNALHGAVCRLIAALRTVAFWLAVCLPVTYLPALVTAQQLLPTLLAVHAAAVALGHGHDPGTRPTADRERRSHGVADRAAD